MSGSDRRRLVRFAMLRQHLCPQCGNFICFDNKDNVYKCKNEDCSYILEQENNISKKIENKDACNETKKQTVNINNVSQTITI